MVRNVLVNRSGECHYLQTAPVPMRPPPLGEGAPGALHLSLCLQVTTLLSEVISPSRNINKAGHPFQAELVVITHEYSVSCQ
jgi:hypothetical protein